MKVIFKSILLPVTCDCCQSILKLSHKDIYFDNSSRYFSNCSKIYCTCKVCKNRIDLDNVNLYGG